MNLQTILIIGAILSLISIIINVVAYFLEKKYKNKMNKFADKK